MPDAKTILFVLLGMVGAAFLLLWGAELSDKAKRPPTDPDKQVRRPSALQAAVGFVTDFFDTLGIGSYATTTTLYRFFKVVPDQLIPGTLNVGHIVPTFAQAFIYMAIIKVDVATLVLLIVASVLGAWLGAGVVAGFSRRKVQIGMGSALLCAAALILCRLLKILPGGGDSLGLSGPFLVVGIAGCFVFGALMTIGVGAYAPIMIMVSLLGMNPDTAFPIMMGACAFLMPVASVRFVRAGSYAPRAALGLTAGGLPAVLLAAFAVWKLPLDAVRWLVVLVVVYTATSMLLAASREARAQRQEKGP